MADVRRSSIFFTEQHISYADILPPPEVRARIEVAVLNFLKVLNSPTPAISILPMINRKTSNSRVNHGLLTEDSWIFLSRSFCTRSLMRENSTKSFIRVWKMMEMCYQILVQEKRVTQRELFYKLLCVSPDYFPSPLQVNQTIQDVVALLRCSRFSLGIMASSRGAVAGRLLLQEPDGEVVDCTTCGSSGYAISGDLNLLEKLIMKTDARYIFVIEKVHVSCNVKWLGLRKDDLDAIPEESFIPLKPKDMQIAKSLISSEILQDNYKEELAIMVQSGKKAEIEALYFHGYDYLGKYLANKVVKVNYI
ncbi:hypothetical protein R6Q59_031082 [Mikania micrantha]